MTDHSIYNVKPNNLIIEFLICTIDEGISKVEEILLSPMPDVRYLVSWQISEKFADAANAVLPKIHVNQKNISSLNLPDALKSRTDVRVVTLAGIGLSRNRNNALKHARGDLLVIADDDCRYTPDSIRSIKEVFHKHADAAIIQMQGLSYEGHLLHNYPVDSYEYQNRPRFTYVSSWELVLRRSNLLPAFDERFGIGAYLGCGEEELFVAMAARKGLKVYYEPIPFVFTDADTSGTKFARSKAVQRAKGGLLTLLHGPVSAFARCSKYAFYYRHEGVIKKVGFLFEMVKGILYVLTHHSVS